MSCWHNDCANKENIYFDNHNKEVIFFSWCFLRDTENVELKKKLWKHLPFADVPKTFLILPLNVIICGMFLLFSPCSFDRQRLVDRRERYRQVRAFLNSGEKLEPV